ncbi:alpha-glucosidase [Catenovulum agarivorans DS-2]|uniref:Alpha-glucosidase n=1 Tax=Catenovulum agarivorans DS-2 TaxID=1328313 RepID=W7Q9L6_9ALTE|nr:TIM-barrel domain-containing protein [Catenovulum agarivorans]EWH08661.1 alpha-glucosidase [Catenovulum agarivorans DS-2]
MKVFKLFVYLYVSLASSCLYALEYQQHQFKQKQLVITTDQGDVTVRFFNPFSVEVQYMAESHSQQSFSLPETQTAKQGQVTATKNQLTYRLSDLSVVVQKKPFNLSFYYENRLLTAEVEQVKPSQSQVQFAFTLSENEILAGAGERVLGMNRRGHQLPLYNKAHYGYGTYSEQMNYSIPGVLSSQGYMLMFDNPAKGSIDIGKKKQNQLQFSAVSGRASYYLVVGDNPQDIVENYVQLTGTQPMPPRWALGYLASRFGYHNEQEARLVVEKFTQAGIPLDGIIFDLFWFGKDVQGHMGNLVWDKQAFPNPKKMISDFKQQGVNTVLITEPFILTTSKQWQSAVDNQVLATNSAEEPYTYDFYFGHTGLIDIFNPKAQDWFWQYYQRQMELGVEGWWGDLGEPEVHPDDIIHSAGRGDHIHNAYGHVWAKTVFEKQRKNFPNKRPFILMRSGFAGSQRYGLIPWTGDVSRSWDGLKPQVELSLQMSLFGLAYTHSDLGGFAGNNWDAEMYIRWLQYGVFQPIYRPHAQEDVAPEPVFHDAKTKRIAKHFINLRYQLMPYLYTMVFDNNVKGTPLMRPLSFAEPDNLDYWLSSNEYLWGDAMLVAPVVNPGVKLKTVNLPNGVWYDFWSDKKIIGGKTVQIPTSIESIPVFVKGGHFIPMKATATNAQKYDSRSLQLHYYLAAKEGQYLGKMYHDDGSTVNAYEHQRYELLNFVADEGKNQLVIEIKREIGEKYQMQSAERHIDLWLHGVEQVTDVILNHQQNVDFVFNATNQTLLIKLEPAQQDLHIKINQK